MPFVEMSLATSLPLRPSRPAPEPRQEPEVAASMTANRDRRSPAPDGTFAECRSASPDRRQPAHPGLHALRRRMERSRQRTGHQNRRVANRVDMSLSSDAKRLAIASASGVLGRAVKLKVVPGATVAPQENKRNGTPRSRIGSRRPRPRRARPRGPPHAGKIRRANSHRDRLQGKALVAGFKFQGCKSLGPEPESRIA